MKTFFHNNKKWMLYGSLFSALTFSISGTNPVTEGSANLAAELPAAEVRTEAKPAAPKVIRLGKVNEAGIAKPSAASTAETPVAVEKLQAAPAVDEKKTSLKSDEHVQNEVSNGNSKIQVKRGTRKIGETEYKFTSYKYENGETQVLWEPEGTEAIECSSGDCQRSVQARVFKGDITDSLSKMVDKIEKDILDKKKDQAKGTKPTDDTDEETEEQSRGQKLLESINTTCDKGNKEVGEQIECKVDKYLVYLNKKLDKQKKKIEITDDEALDFFNEHLKDGLKEMLTHKFAMPVVYSNDSYDQYNTAMELNEEKALARKEKDKAVKLIKNLLRNLGSKYKDVKKEVSKLHNESVTDQAKEALMNYRDMKIAEKNKDLVGQRYNFGSFVMNDEFLRSLDRDLYSGISSGLYDARKTMDSSFLSQIMRDLNNSHTGICQTYSREIGQSIESCGTSTGVSSSDSLSNLIRNSVSNASRGGRGDVNSAPQSSGGVRILQNGRLLNGNGNSSINTNLGTTTNRVAPGMRGN
jgi:hypothetical protein